MSINRINKKIVTMHKSYGEPNDKLGKHLVCQKCGFCKTCKDCEVFGCNVNKK